MNSYEKNFTHGKIRVVSAEEPYLELKGDFMSCGTWVALYPEALKALKEVMKELNI